MEDRKENIPAVRFKGFTDAWEQRELELLKNMKKSLLKAMFI